jgi:hypothetical protein
MVTVAALTTAGNTEQLTYHLGLARQNGATETELTEKGPQRKEMSPMNIEPEAATGKCPAAWFTGDVYIDAIHKTPDHQP